MRKLSVVVMENHDLLRQVMVTAIENAGFSAYGVFDADALRAHLHEHPADMVVLDLNAPQQHGLTTAQELRDASPGLGLLALSSNHQARVEAYTHGADVFLTKPCDTDVLIAALQRLGNRVLNTHSTQGLTPGLLHGGSSQPSH